MRLGSLVLATLVAALSVSPASAQSAEDEEGFAATARVEAPVPAGAGDDPTAAATRVDVASRPHAFDTLDEVAREVPGAQAWATGAYGAFRALSLRGADGDHTTVMLGDLPLAAEGEAFDLSTIPTSLLDRIEVYRGGAPVWLGAGGIGGVLRLVPRSGARTVAEASAGVGSFGLVHGRLTASVVDGDGAPAFSASAGAVHSDGDFPFLYDPTALVPGDEREVRRRNADVDEGHGLVHFATRAGGGRLETAVLGLGRTGGVPGPAIQVSNARRATSSLLGTTSWEREADRGARATAPWRVRVSAGGSYERDALADRLGEIGVGRGSVTDDRTLRVRLLAAGEAEVTDWLALTAVASGMREEHRPHDALREAQVGASERWSGAVAGEARLSGRLGGARFELRPSARLRVVRARLFEIAAGREGQADQSLVTAPTLRLGGAIEPIRGLALTASVATETRAPSLLELFGDRAFLLGDTRLRPERSVAVDAGALARGRLGIARGSVEARVFASFADDLVRYRRTAQSQAVPENVARARTVGAEVGLRGDLGRHVGVTGALTWLAPEDLELGRTLPLRPRLSAYARPEVRLGPFGSLGPVVLFVDVVHVAAMFADPQNLVVVPGRTLLGAGAAVPLLDERLVVSATGSDLLDTRPSDVLGFPLPGRSFEITLTGRTESW